MGLRTIHIVDPHEQQTRITSLIGTLVLHGLLLFLLSILSIGRSRPLEFIELDWGSSSGAPNQSTVEPTTETVQKQMPTPRTAPKTAEKPKVDLPAMKSPSDETLPAKEKAKKESVDNRRPTAEATSKATERRAERAMPAGSGKTTGYSIEWSGVGSRKLLSGRMPRYPDGTDKEMPVLLQFAVLPDGSVTGIIPLRRSDELLEREAISALRTWRFDPLPAQYQQNPQIGKVTFNFVLE